MKITTTTEPDTVRNPASKPPSGTKLLWVRTNHTATPNLVLFRGAVMDDEAIVIYSFGDYDYWSSVTEWCYATPGTSMTFTAEEGDNT